MSIFDDKGRLLKLTWYTCMAVSVAYVIAALVLASRLSKSETPVATQPTAFAAIWSMLVLLAILIGGTLVFNRVQTPVATGVLLGCTAMFSQIELMLFTIFEAHSRDAVTASEKSAGQATATFAFFLAVIFGVFSIFLLMWRQYLHVGSSQSSMDSYA
ncbi:hypothetical protein NGA_0208701 [Nannochloropsis gaditana CCMP526]|nr:hypothetical protein NGA_0208701 [Nannochloropsis gaditana CCMP526]XP_005854850.1 hypothetical protein NGA_0208702 [Nannochloropsis gaditana CCMP526]EKU21504.1 hypothetical protein NGA_0208702 [Nannochloropsis gaditana CCMP526]EKU22037.1 hypothetical protein NGA_0208701 [Nannochloropsis gaditana CCMP526]|eukprot:XP_005854322.1 hypothetical protein NGA_0208701 [Nannochloropsis gaditana CCMP526]